ncbi:hypothetical protein HR060_02380 [Catenovulum sp. SM1970]|uniref:hypothetical protein n=1 Tax=Marinifaba aquimaris TaxID=2741323 RepID=UPI001573EB97|nr:hypothetical protein [Marinifaba aquimaris]NTS75702.1 hypothetical protein [Marinifaba aquimaris]
MIRLSRRGWNNVLIFASLIMILLFNGVHNKLLENTEKAGAPLALLPKEQVLLTLDLPNYSIERVGKEWRLRPENTVELVKLNQLMTAWYQAQALVMTEQEQSVYQGNTNPDWVAVAWFAGEAKGYVLQGYVSEQRLVVFDQQRELWLKLPANLNEQLILTL